jgi:hypothetical protein
MSNWVPSDDHEKGSFGFHPKPECSAKNCEYHQRRPHFALLPFFDFFSIFVRVAPPLRNMKHKRGALGGCGRIARRSFQAESDIVRRS